MDLTIAQTIVLAIITLMVGRFLTQQVTFLHKYNIPEAVSGGIAASIIFLLIYLIWDLQFEFHEETRDLFLIIFFTCIGISANLSELAKGGKALGILVIMSLGILIVQDMIGVGFAMASGYDPKYGLIGGSISLSGGHATSIAWSTAFEEEYGLPGVMDVGMACATLGLIAGGLIGGPMALRLITKHKIQHEGDEPLTVGVKNEREENITADDFYRVLLVVGISVAMGMYANDILVDMGFQLPPFVTCLLSGIILNNTIPRFWPRMPWPRGTNTIGLFSEVSLGLFLSISLMSLKLWILYIMAGPILILMALQIITVVSFSAFVVFRFLGKDYDAVVIAAGFVGISLGATPTAMVNMSAVTKNYGNSTKAFLVIPLIGAFFLDIMNATVIQFFLSLLE